MTARQSRGAGATDADKAALLDAIALVLGYDGVAEVSLDRLSELACLPADRCEALMGELEQAQAGQPWSIRRVGGSGLDLRWSIDEGGQAA